MSSGSWTLDIESPVAAPRLFKAALLDWHTLGPKIVPAIVVSGTVLQGDGSAGSLRKIDFTPVLPFSYIIERLDFVDNDKCEVKQTLVEGGEIGTKLESACTHFKIEPTASGGSLVKVTAEYKLVHGVDDKDGEEKAKESVTGIIKAAEGFLLANPEAYA